MEYVHNQNRNIIFNKYNKLINISKLIIPTYHIFYPSVTIYLVVSLHSCSVTLIDVVALFYSCCLNYFCFFFTR